MQIVINAEKRVQFFSFFISCLLRYNMVYMESSNLVLVLLEREFMHVITLSFCNLDRRYTIKINGFGLPVRNYFFQKLSSITGCGITRHNAPVSESRFFVLYGLEQLIRDLSAMRTVMMIQMCMQFIQFFLFDGPARECLQSSVTPKNYFSTFPSTLIWINYKQRHMERQK